MLLVRDLTKRFGATRAVDTVTLEVAEGELVCLLGPSGCGKSTLLRMVAGLTSADDGAIVIDGADVTAQPANRRPTAMVFQSHALWPHMTAERNIGFGLRVRGVPGDAQRARIAAALDLVGLAGFERRYPGEMSGGQAQRVALARCLVVEPRVLLMDEPFSALDAHLRKRLREDLKALQQRLGLTTLFVTHDQDEAMELADRIAVMREGRIEQVDPPSEIYLNPRTLHVARFIGGMNETEVALREGHATWHGISLPLGAPTGTYRGLSRPEDLETSPSGAPFRVERSVDLGAAIRLQMRSSNGDPVSWVTARAAAPDVGTTVSLWPRRLLLYQNDQLVSAATPHLDPAL